MPRPSPPPRLGEAQEFFLSLHEDVAVDLHIYCEVLAAQKSKIINKAVRALIQKNLRENQGFQNEFRQMKQQFVDGHRRKMRRDKTEKFQLIKPRDGHALNRGTRQRTKPPANSEDA
jgi:5'-deoxynucleotidase YfbR-like HD superfamily hydrolase